ncbi:MAG: hypothetical protein MHPSP_000777 [Paramarteilia canceri]
MSKRSVNALVMCNMGGPHSTSSVPQFLERLFRDPDIIELPFRRVLSKIIVSMRAHKVAKKYSEIGGFSPQISWTEKQGKAVVDLLSKRFPNEQFECFTGFRYSEPFLGSTLQKLEILLIECFVDLIKKKLSALNQDILAKTVLLFTAHSVVERGDCYPAEVSSTVQLICKQLKYILPYRLCWQSKVGPKAWLGPSTEQTAIALLEKDPNTHLMVIPVTFNCDHIETLHELDIELLQDLKSKVGF